MCRSWSPTLVIFNFKEFVLTHSLSGCVNLHRNDSVQLLLAYKSLRFAVQKVLEPYNVLFFHLVCWE